MHAMTSRRCLSQVGATALMVAKSRQVTPVILLGNSAAVRACKPLKMSQLSRSATNLWNSRLYLRETGSEQFRHSI